MHENFHFKLKKLIDEYITEVYTLTKDFPNSEIYGITSQLRRSALSIMLNYIEGFARCKKLVMKNFFEISYGSLKESQYLVYFSNKLNYIDQIKYNKLNIQADKIGAMLWGIIQKIK